MFFLRLLGVFFVLLLCSNIFAHNESRIGFIENKKQFHQNVLFQGNLKNYTVFLEQNRFTFLLENAEDLNALHDLINEPLESENDFFVRSHAYRVNFNGANQDAIVEKDRTFDFSLNYFLGSDESRWATNVRSYRNVKYLDLYDGIDLLAVVDKGNLKYDFIVKPQANPELIELEFEGLDKITLIDGDLVMATSVGEVKELKPFAYQQQNGILKPVNCRFVLQGNRVKFSFPDGYDNTKELVIDPVVIAATLSGTPGFQTNYAHGATYDLAGNIYTYASAFGNLYPVTVGALQTSFNGGTTDIAISKYNPTGTELIYATYLGGSGKDTPHSAVANQFEELYVFGTTNSTNYPISAFAFDQTFNDVDTGNVILEDIVISKISADGTVLMGSTYVGGLGADGLNLSVSVNYLDKHRGDIMLDVLGYPCVVSQTKSMNFPVTDGAFETTLQGGQDVVVFKMTPDLTGMVWSTFLGSPDDDTGYGLKVANNGDVLVCGSTKGAEFPTTSGVFQESISNPSGTTDAFVARLSADGSQLLYSTYMGTDQTDQAFFVDFDSDENVWIYGQSVGNWFVEGSGNYSTPNGKLFVTKLNPQLNDILVSSRVGPGTGFNADAAPSAFRVDECNRIYISGYQAFSGFELTDDALYTEGGIVVCVWEENMSELAFSTYYGGNHVDGGVSRFNQKGVIYQGVCSGGGFQTNPDAWATTQNASWDVGVFKIDFEFSNRLEASILGLDSIYGCAPFEIQVESGVIGNQYTWNWGDESPDNSTFSSSHIYSEPGTYVLQLVVFDSLSCNGFDSTESLISISGTPDANFSFTILDITGEYSFNNQSANYSNITWILNSDTVSTDPESFNVFLQPGLNEVCVFVENDCGSDLYCETIVVTSINDIQSNQSTSVYPNPTTDFLNVIFRRPAIEIKLYDAIGKEFSISTVPHMENFVINTSGLSSGTYFLWVDYSDIREVIRFTKH